jgi:hypothetical protein
MSRRMKDKTRRRKMNPNRNPNKTRGRSKRSLRNNLSSSSALSHI